MGQHETVDVAPGWGSGLLSADPVGYRAATQPQRLACIELTSGRRLSYRELDEQVSRCAGWLAATTSGSGARIALLGRNSIDAVVLTLACQRLGAVCVPLNWRLTAAELGPILHDAAPALLVADAEFEVLARQARPAGGPLVMVLGADGLAPMLAEATPAQPITTPAGAPCLLLYTSGTTGRPKGVIVTRQNAFYAALNFAFVGAVGPHSVALLDLPMFHTIGLVAVTRTTLTMGGTLVISDRFMPERTLAALSDPAIGVTHYFCVPQMAAALRDDPRFEAARLSQLSAIFVGGAPVPRPLIEAWLGDGIPLVNGFGMTEAGTVIHVPVDADAVRQNAGAIGLPAPLLEVKLVDADGNGAPDGTPGELWLRGPSVTPGYWNDAAASAAAFTDGWFRTGDLLVRDANGFYRLVDRLKDMYISGGENVFPAEIEAVLLAHPAVAEAAVVGVPDGKWGEAGIAHVVLRQPGSASETELLAYCESRLARYKRPHRIMISDTIPRTASGKIIKHVLRDQYRAQPGT
ncbi:MAG: AMP-binding protein [Devosia sp.]|nr:AMP-binding protein [Devosia sp.]